MKRIAFIIESNAVGGAERVLRDIVNNIDREKYDVTVFSLFKYSVYRGTSQFDDFFCCKYRWCVDNGNKLYSKIGYYLINRFPNFFYKLFIGNKYDTLVAFYEGLPADFIARINTKAHKIAWLHTSVDLSLPIRNEVIIEKKMRVYQAFEKIVCVSDGVRNSFVGLFSDLYDKTCVAYNPIDVSRIRNLSEKDIGELPKKTFTFVAVGRIIPCKGYERIIEVAPLLKNEGLSFNVWIIGGGGGHVKLMEMAQKKGVGDMFTFWGNQSNPYPYIKQADCVISSSYIEGLGMTLLEGLALGKMVLSTDCQCTGEILGEHSEYGVMVDNTENGLYEGMRKILTDKRLKNIYEQKAVERAQFFDVNNSICKIEALLEGGC
jgi:glycosyltransferase involved in cell wall biosynthesis